MASYAYSFADVAVTISGPGGSGSLTVGGVANEGITVTFNERVTTQYGADGTWMHVLHAAKGGKITIRLLKNGAANYLLGSIYNFDSASSSNTGQNLITILNPVSGDDITGRGCACIHPPTVTYNTDGAMNEWEYNVGSLSAVFGNGALVTV